ncbi:hypothetical protein D9M73_65970 [compost metagenome]|nr:MAG TPA: hypothetical protein [Caudoviricetes sp.]
MNDETPTCEPTAPTFWSGPPLSHRLRMAGQSLRYRLQRILFRAAMALAEDEGSRYESHARTELRALGYKLDDKEEGPNQWIVQNLLDLLRVFSTQGHSGASAPYCISQFEKLATFKPLCPLTGADSEWFDHGDGMFQNMRDGRVFKQPDRFDGQAYFLNGRVFREPNGVCYTNRESMVPITFPCTPEPVYVDVPASPQD